MSELINNLNEIYSVKLQIKEAIGTESDDFSQYPSYISSMVTPTGTSYISENGTHDISTYAYAYVNVSGGGGTSYTTVYSMSQLWDDEQEEYIGPENNADVDVRGVALVTLGTEIDSEMVSNFNSICEGSGDLIEEYIGQYLVGFYPDESAGFGDGTLFFVFPTESVFDDTITWSVKGKWHHFEEEKELEPGLVEWSKMFILTDVSSYEQIPIGGVGEMNISENGTFCVSSNAFVNVEVSGGASVSGTYGIFNYISPTAPHSIAPMSTGSLDSLGETIPAYVTATTLLNVVDPTSAAGTPIPADYSYKAVILRNNSTGNLINYSSTFPGGASNGDIVTTADNQGIVDIKFSYQNYQWVEDPESTPEFPIGQYEPNGSEQNYVFGELDGCVLPSQDLGDGAVTFSFYYSSGGDSVYKNGWLVNPNDFVPAS